MTGQQVPLRTSLKAPEWDRATAISTGPVAANNENMKKLSTNVLPPFQTSSESSGQQ